MVTLEISSDEIRVIEVDRGRVVSWARQILEPGIMDAESVLDPQGLGIAIRRLLSSSGIRTNEVICSVSGLYSLSRIVLVSVPPGGTVSYQAVLDAAYDVMPIAEEEVYLSWQSIGSIEGGQQVLIISVPRDIINGNMQALKVAGIKSRVLDLKAMAVMRAVNNPKALIINVETTSFDIILVNDGILEIMRTNAWNSAELSTEEKAEQLALSLELTTGFYNSRHSELPLAPDTPLYVAGQMTEDFNLIDILEDRVSCNISTFFPPLECPPNLPVAQYAVCIGLALKGTQSVIENLEEGIHTFPDINLLPAEYKPWRPSGRQIYATFAIVAVIALLMPMYNMTMNAMSKTAKLEAELTSFNNLLDMRRLELSKREPLQNTIDSYYSILSADDTVTDDITLIRDEAKRLGVSISGLQHSINKISVSCTADSYILFRKYVKALEDSGRFSTPVVPPEGYPYIKSGHILITPITTE